MRFKRRVESIVKITEQYKDGTQMANEFSFRSKKDAFAFANKKARMIGDARKKLRNGNPASSKNCIEARSNLFETRLIIDLSGV